GSKQFIRDRILDTVRKAGNWGHILNLGHGVLPETPEENVAFFRWITAKAALNWRIFGSIPGNG
ncbi:hypothetical protein LC605_22050, partial [Nostoc sp. CHAB 5836]|uniref:uroporphyrinogen decarboxylase family protein n=1 Tax=Nostoc sp. CHAB 5836 TaxID=2780404 RepID=UPI002795CE61